MPETRTVTTVKRMRDVISGEPLRHLRSGSPSLTFNCGYGHGLSVLEVVDMVKRMSASISASKTRHNEQEMSPEAWRRQNSSAQRLVGNPASTISRPSSPMRSLGSAN